MQRGVHLFSLYISLYYPVSVTYIGNKTPGIAYIKEFKKLVRFRSKSISQAHFKVIERSRRERKKKHANKTKTTKETKNQNKNGKQLAAVS